MSDTDTKAPSEKTLHLATPKLSLKRPSEQNTVRQSFSHGRTKSVVVETKKRRVGPAVGKDAPNAAAAAAAAPARRAPTAGAAAPAQPQAATAPAARPTGMVLRTLSDSERDARANALADARVREEEDRRHAEEESKRRAEREARDARERAAAEARKRDEEERRHKEDERKRRAEDEARRRLGEEPLPARGPPGPRPAPGDARRPQSLNHMARPAPSAADPAAARPAATGLRAPGRPVQAEDEAEGKRIIRRPGMPTRIITPPKTPRAPGGNRNRGRLTIATATGGEDERTRSLASFRRRMQRLTGNRAAEPKEKLAREVIVPETITIQELANRMSERAVDVIRLLMKQGQLLKITDAIDADTAQLVAEELGHTVKRVAESDVEEGLFDTPDVDETIEPRPPVVTIMGHVDHGKTSLLDAVRKTNVVSGEAGGITQHIGAYQVTSPLGGKITFIDTPGHAAFTAMRARGAKVTDIVVLVVAADDGVMPQTIEAIEHSRAAGVPIIVAINKIDKPDANPDRVRQELAQQGLSPLDWGGETEMVQVSAKKRQNLETLLETILLTSDILNLRASPTRLASGVVLEAKLDRGRGAVATVLVQQGTLKIHEPFIVGQISGRVRAMFNDRGEPITEAGPATPVEVLGLQGVPQAGESFQVVSDIAKAQSISQHRQMLSRQAALLQTTKRGIEALGESEVKELLVIIKADVQGSVEVLKSTLQKLSTDRVKVKVIRSGVGAITESDVLLGSATQAGSSSSAVVIIGFNVRPEARAADVAKQEDVDIRLHSIIYKVEEEIRAAMIGMLEAIEKEKILGKAAVREVFRVPKAGTVAGCMVVDGLVRRNARARLIRDGVVSWEGNISSLRRFKDDVSEVREGFECGISLENFNDVKVGDQIEAYIVERVAATEL
ncbi:MAG: translation initiation factor IF-2 [Microvirga sp.]